MSDRFIYGPYESGQGPRWADPAAAYDLMQLHTGGQLKEVIEQSKARVPIDSDQTDAEGNPIVLREVPHYEASVPAKQALLAAVAKTFDLKPFDPQTGEGLTQDDVLALWNGYVSYCKAIKKKRSDSPSAAPPMGADFWLAATSTTGSASASS